MLPKPISPVLNSRHTSSSLLTSVTLLRGLKLSTYLNTPHRQPLLFPNGACLFSSSFKEYQSTVLKVVSPAVSIGTYIIPVQSAFTDLFFYECQPWKVNISRGIGISLLYKMSRWLLQPILSLWGPGCCVLAPTASRSLTPCSHTQFTVFHCM